MIVMMRPRSDSFLSKLFSFFGGLFNFIKGQLVKSFFYLSLSTLQQGTFVLGKSLAHKSLDRGFIKSQDGILRKLGELLLEFFDFSLLLFELFRILLVLGVCSGNTLEQFLHHAPAH
jgi:hypothetical protein